MITASPPKIKPTRQINSLRPAVPSLLNSYPPSVDVETVRGRCSERQPRVWCVDHGAASPAEVFRQDYWRGWRHLHGARHAGGPLTGNPGGPMNVARNAHVGGRRYLGSASPRVTNRLCLRTGVPGDGCRERVSRDGGAAPTGGLDEALVLK